MHRRPLATALAASALALAAALAPAAALASGGGGAAPGESAGRRGALESGPGGAAPNDPPRVVLLRGGAGGARYGVRPRHPRARTRRLSSRRRPVANTRTRRRRRAVVTPRRTPVRRPPTRRRATTPPPSRDGVFPVRGAWSFGGADARFGAPRSGHTHQGQDVLAAEGTPIVAPLSGVISYRAYQARGAGYYLVERGNDGRDYVFMHMERGSWTVTVGDAVRAGQRLGSVGATGDATGPHLHFEIWVGGWYTGGHPIDPLPTLRRWAR